MRRKKILFWKIELFLKPIVSLCSTKLMNDFKGEPEKYWRLIHGFGIGTWVLVYESAAKGVFTSD